ncbi:hypothetical protein F8S09_13895 [Deinococcus sp. SDU3-2]|uniref:Uncharacterized protein n=1 Tax=Deinococcus terrestris TaxID=2651870 RepID=A0A7X1NYC4_9DEIO|nr:hypothetical protein [Deinococcus terrestris]MPY67759.1 hypothetical protein [Deinococcus terrestris]
MKRQVGLTYLILGIVMLVVCWNQWKASAGYDLGEVSILLVLVTIMAVGITWLGWHYLGRANQEQASSHKATALKKQEHE